MGRSKENEYKENLHEITKRLVGQVVLMFTNESQEQVEKWFANYSEKEYARSGNTATATFTIPEGPLDENTYPASMEPNLRKLGIPTSLVKGVVHVTQDHEVCKEGDTLTPEQCTVLERFYQTQVEFRMDLRCVWHSSGIFQDLAE